MQEVKQELVPFGKFKGQPIERLFEDQSYVKWISEQDGIRQRYPQFYNLVINNFTSVPVDTPEHNEMQIKFLKREHRLKLTYLLDENFLKYDTSHCLNELKKLYFRMKDNSSESRDILYQYGGSSIKQFKEGISWLKEDTQLLYDDGANFEVKGSDVEFECEYGYNIVCCFNESYSDWINRNRKRLDFSKCHKYRIELKPVISNDFPSVLREMKLHKSNILIIKDFSCSNISFDDVVSYFDTAGIKLIREIDIENVILPKYEEDLKLEIDEKILLEWDKEFENSNHIEVSK
jgi:hypothetical protein